MRQKRIRAFIAMLVFITGEGWLGITEISKWVRIQGILLKFPGGSERKNRILNSQFSTL
jgi:hypothetical protein